MNFFVDTLLMDFFHNQIEVKKKKTCLRKIKFHMLRMDCVPCLLSLIVIQSSLQFRPYHYDFMATHKLSFPSALFWTAENSPAKKRKKGPQCSTVLFEQYISDSTHIA